MKATVHIMLKKGVLDPQGKAIGQALAGMGYDEVGAVRQGKLIELDLGDAANEARVREMCEKLLANPVIEDYTVTLETA